MTQTFSMPGCAAVASPSPLSPGARRRSASSSARVHISSTTGASYSSCACFSARAAATAVSSSPPPPFLSSSPIPLSSTRLAPSLDAAVGGCGGGSGAGQI